MSLDLMEELLRVENEQQIKLESKTLNDFLHRDRII